MGSGVRKILALEEVTRWPPLHVEAQARDGRTVAHASGGAGEAELRNLGNTPQWNSREAWATWPLTRRAGCEDVGHRSRGHLSAGPGGLAGGCGVPATLCRFGTCPACDAHPHPPSRPPFLPLRRRPPSCPSLLCWRCLSSDVAFLSARVSLLRFVCGSNSIFLTRLCRSVRTNEMLMNECIPVL